MKDSSQLSEKENKLLDIRREVEGMRDRLGEPIDEDIKETVVMVRAFGFPTDASCEGHADHGFPAPWVEISEDMPEAEDKGDQIMRKMYSEKNEEYKRKFSLLLEEFYKHRDIDPDVALHLSPISYCFRLQSKGLDRYDTEVPPDRVGLYKKEMKEFTEFLKKKYFELIP